jgi:hypothetical protein
MTLKEYLLEQPYEQIALLWFEGGQIRCEEYGLNDYDKIDKELLQMEFMESNDEEDCKEIWIR